MESPTWPRAAARAAGCQTRARGGPFDHSQAHHGRVELIPYLEGLPHRLAIDCGNVLENWPEPQKAEPNTRTETRSAWRGRDRERERESDGVLGRARQLRLPTMAAQGGLQLRVSSGAKNEKTREMRSVTERYATRSSAPTREEREKESGALLGVTLCGAPPRREKTKRETERGSSTEGPTYHCLLGLLTSSFLLCVSQRG